MKRLLAAFVLVALAGCAPEGATEPFKRAHLRIEINATDGDAGLQIDLDHEPWRSLRIQDPDGRTILDVTNRGVLEGYGLTELFSESSEPPFSELPLDEFTVLFPEGGYRFTGKTIDDVRMESVVTLTHDFPAGPEILAPTEDSEISPGELVAEWVPGRAAGAAVVAYQVVVVQEVEPSRSLMATVPANVNRLAIPAAFLSIAGDYKVEVLAISASGNQTLTEVPFTVG